MTMNNLCLFDTETGLIKGYPRGDEMPVERLDARYEVLRVVRETAPQYDPATHSLGETRTIDREAGEWLWGWAVEPLPHVPPSPDWRTFKRTLLAHPAINALLGGSLSQAPAAGLSLPATLLAAAGGGEVDDFRAAWLALRREGLVSSALVQEVRTLALMLPIARPDGVGAPFLTALFVATSATAVWRRRTVSRSAG
jgi:hypothetical protein